MANQSHLDIILQGVETWNAWRHQNLMVEVDLSGADLSGKDLSGIRLEAANLRRIKLIDANLQGAVLVASNFKHADFTGANLNSARLNQADMTYTRFINVDIRNADLSGANFEHSRIYNVKYNRWAKYQGIRLADCHGSQVFIRYAIDQSYIEEFRGESSPTKELLFNDPKLFAKKSYQVIRYLKSFPPIFSNPKFWFIYLPWLILSDCGRSFGLWFTWSLAIAVFFGAVYAGYPAPDWVPENLRQILMEIRPIVELERDRTGFTPYYFSVVTFTTLGFGDVLPKNLAGELWLTVEVIIGYIMLGGLISIFASKLARRGV